MTYVWIYRSKQTGLWRAVRNSIARHAWIGIGLRAVTIESAREDYGVTVPGPFCVDAL